MRTFRFPILLPGETSVEKPEAESRLKRLLSIVLLLSFLAPSLIKVVIFIDFKLNQDYIARVLCINKEKPLIMCNGKCYLSRQLGKVKEKEEKNALISAEEKTAETLYIQEIKNPFPGIICETLSESPFIEVLDLYASSYIREVFHPPRTHSA